MRFSKQIVGIAAAAILAAGIATADRANAGTTSGTQIEYVESSSTANVYATIAFWRAYAVALAVSAL